MQLTLLTRLAPFDVLEDVNFEAEEGIDAPIPKFVAFPMKTPQSTTSNMAPGNGNPNCGQPELISMLWLLKEHLPIGEVSWEKVSQLH